MHRRQRQQQETQQDAGCGAAPWQLHHPPDSLGWFYTFTCTAPSYCHRLNRTAAWSQASPPPRVLAVSQKKGPDKLCIYICIERHFQRHSQGNGLAEYRCYLRMTTIQAILLLHYLSGEIRLVCIFTRIISFKSADDICSTLRTEASQVGSKDLASVLPTETIFHRHAKTRRHQNLRSHVKCLSLYSSFLYKSRRKGAVARM